jgi:prepilin-type N-terminal cleavage/methylation domain-containing protein
MKEKGGFTLVELIVVIGLLLLLSVGAYFVMRGVQENALHSALKHDANALAEAINNYNATVASFGGTPVEAVGENNPPDLDGFIADNVVVLVVPTIGGTETISFSVSYGNETRLNQVVDSVMYSGGMFVPNFAHIEANY